MLFHAKAFSLKPFLWFAPDSGGGGGDGSDADAGTGGGDGGEKTDKKFSQGDLDKLVGEARKSGRETATKTLLTELGLESVEALKSFLTDAKKLKEAQLSEAEKQKLALETAQKEANDAKAEKDKAIALANERLMKAAIIAEASKADHKVNPAAINDVWAFVDRTKLKVDESGEVTGMAEAVTAVIKAKPYLQVSGKTASMPLRENKNGTRGEEKRVPTISKL